MKNKINLILITTSLMLLFGCADDPSSTELPSLSIEDITVTETEDIFVVPIDLVLTGTNNKTVVVKYEASSGSAATVNEDFEEFEESEITFLPGVNKKTILLNIVGDDLNEPDETLRINIVSVSNAILTKSFATITIFDNDEPAGFDGALVIPENGYTTPNSYDGMNLVWSDEFNGESINLDNWTFEVGTGNNGWGNNELQYYTDGDNAFIEDGNLIIQANKEIFGGRQFTSSRMVTRNKQVFKYGRVDIRAAVPTGKGVWPALWMLGENFSGVNAVGWPRCGEIDIMELVSQSPNKIYGTTHWFEQGNPNNNQASSGGHKFLLNGETYDMEFHVFSLIWEEDHIEILVDDVEYFTISNSAGFGGEWPFNQPFFFIFNVAIGGNWPVNPDASSNFPQYMIVDYIRVFQ